MSVETMKNMDEESKKTVPRDVKPKEESDVKQPKEDSKQPSGRDVLQGYLAGTAMAQLMYRKLCSAMNLMGSWTMEARQQLIEQFLPAVDLMNEQCKELVTSLVNIQFYDLPENARDNYQKLLCNIAVRQVNFTDTVYASVVRFFIPKIILEEETQIMVRAYPEKDDIEYFTRAHQIIAHILRCFPSSHAVLLRSLRVSFPYQTQPSIVIVSYIKNLIQVAEYAPVVASEVWDLIIQQILQCDALAHHSVASAENSNLQTDLHPEMFMLDEEIEELKKPNESNDNIAKMDRIMEILIGYVEAKNGLGEDLPWLHHGDDIDSDILFRLLCSNLESKLLLAVDVKYLSFLWLYLGSISERNCNMILDLLWSTISRPPRNQVDAKKAQGAAAFLAAFVARAKYIKTDAALKWINRMLQWCIRYTESVHLPMASTGSLRHGLFYSLCQSFFISFSFRYKEFVKDGSIEEIRRWSMGRVIHSTLEPLRYVNRPVAKCFASITRSLQLVYCNHVLDNTMEHNMPFESMFPFDSYHLSRSGNFIAPLIRRFSPLSEDKEALTAALTSRSKGDEDSMDFLEYDDMIVGSNRTENHYGKQDPMFTVYSTSPGLRHF